MSRTLLSLALAGVVGIASVVDASACACCTEPGQRLESSGAIASYERGEVAQVKFAPSARLFVDNGFPDSISGIRSPSDQDYQLAVTSKGTDLVFAFRDTAGLTGSIVFTLPKTFTRFEVDPRDASTPPGGNGPTLYKEWRLQGLARLEGSLADKGKWAHVRLVLQGTGNSCTSAYDFSSWSIDVTGKNIGFRFLGTTVR